MLLTWYSCVILSIGAITADGAAPNIVILLVDDLGFNDVGFHGSPQILTPTIDDLVTNATVLSRYYTLHLCTPSRTSLMTGRYPANIGMQSVVLNPSTASYLPLNMRLMPEYFKNMGYSTHALGKWHLGYSAKEHTPTYRGFDTFLGSYTSGVDHFTHERSYEEMTGVDFHDNVGTNLRCTSQFYGQHSTDVLSNRAVNIITSHNFQEAPLFVYLSFQAVHKPSQAKVEDFALFPDVHDTNRRHYVASIKNVDDAIRQIVESLKTRGVLNDTIIVFCSDGGGSTGPGSNYPLRAGKGWLFEGGVRVPAFVMGPGIPSQRQFDSYFHTSDWLPTLYAAAGGDVTHLGPLDGINQWRALTDDLEIGSRSEILLNVKSDEYGLIDGDYKLVACWGSCYGNKKYQDGWHYYLGPMNESDTDRHESKDQWSPPLVHCNLTAWDNRRECLMEKQEQPCLFNIKTDPCEFDNIADREPGIVERMSIKLEEHRERILAPIRNENDQRSNPDFNNGCWQPWLVTDDF